MSKQNEIGKEVSSRAGEQKPGKDIQGSPDNFVADIFSPGDNQTIPVKEPGAGTQKATDYRVEPPKPGEKPQVDNSDILPEAKTRSIYTETRDKPYIKDGNGGSQPVRESGSETLPKSGDGAKSLPLKQETKGGDATVLPRSRAGEPRPETSAKPAPDAVGTSGKSERPNQPPGDGKVQTRPAAAELGGQPPQRVDSRQPDPAATERLKVESDRVSNQPLNKVTTERANSPDAEPRAAAERGGVVQKQGHNTLGAGEINAKSQALPSRNAALREGSDVAPTAGESMTLRGSTARDSTVRMDNKQGVPVEGDPFSASGKGSAHNLSGKALPPDTGLPADVRGEKANQLGKVVPNQGAETLKGESKALVEPLGDVRAQKLPGQLQHGGESAAGTKLEGSSASSERSPHDDIRSGKLIDQMNPTDIASGERGLKHGARLDVKYDSNGKRIELNGEEILVWDGKNSPLYPSQRGKRVSRFVESGQGPGRRGPRGGRGTGKFGDPATALDPKDRAKIDRVIKETDRIFFGDKSSKRSQKTKGKFGGKGKDSATEKSTGSKSGEVRSGKNLTTVGKGTRAESGAGDRGDAGSKIGRDGGKRGGIFSGQLPDHVPFPGLKLQDFKIRWPLGKRGADRTRPDKVGTKDDRGIKTDRGIRGDRGDRGLKTGKGTRVEGGEKGVSGKASGEAGATRSHEANIRSIDRSFSTMLPESRVKLVRNLEPSRSEIKSTTDSSVNSNKQSVTFKPSRITLGTRAGADATFVPSSVLIQPLDWGSLRGWLGLNGVLRGGKGRRVPEYGTVRGDTATVKSGGKTAGADTATVKTGARAAGADTATVKTGGKTAGADTATVKSDSGKPSKAKPELIEPKEKTSAKKTASGKRAESSNKANIGSSSMKESKDAFAGKLPSIKMNYSEKTGKVASDAQNKAKAFSEIQNKVAKAAPKGGIPTADAPATRTGAERLSNQPADFDLNTGKVARGEGDSVRARPDGDKARVSAEGKEGRLILRDLLTNKGSLKGGFSRVLEQRLDGARVIEGAHLLSIYIGMQQARGASIREVLAGLRYLTPKRSFTPEITDSGSYKVARGHSSQQMIAFGSSAKHVAINYQLDRSESDLSLSSSQEAVDREGTGDDANNFLRDSNASKLPTSEEARKWYIVQEGDTTEFIAVVQLNDESLAPLIYEINKPLFQQLFDIYKEEHVDTLPAGTMILLPNEKDIAEFKKPDES